MVLGDIIWRAESKMAGMCNPCSVKPVTGNAVMVRLRRFDVISKTARFMYKSNTDNTRKLLLLLSLT